MIVYRLTQAEYKDQLTGIGAELYVGRWSSKGVRIIYTSQSRALCTTEIAVHTPLGIIPSSHYLQSINIPDGKFKQVKTAELDKKWKAFPHHNSSKSIGDNFINENKSLVLKVPSAVIQGDYNYIINPKHKLFSKVEILSIESFGFDKRLFIR